MHRKKNKPNAISSKDWRIFFYVFSVNVYTLNDAFPQTGNISCAKNQNKTTTPNSSCAQLPWQPLTSCAPVPCLGANDYPLSLDWYDWKETPWTAFRRTSKEDQLDPRTQSLQSSPLLRYAKYSSLNCIFFFFRLVLLCFFFLPQNALVVV